MKNPLLSAILGASLALFTAVAAAQTFPTKPIRLIVPFTPGGSNDVLGRVIAEKLTASLGQPVVVENRPGASGNLGADLVAKSAPDGHTLLIAANNILVMNPALFKRMPFDSIKDFKPISVLGTVPVVLVARPSLNLSSVKDLITTAQKAPGKLNYASSGMGSPQHLSAELFKSMTKTFIVHIPYKGQALAVNDLLGGQVDLQFGAVNSLLPHIKAGKLTALAVGGARRITPLPGVPTVAEAGVAGYDSDIWVGLVAPAMTPQPIVDQINREVRKIMAMPDVVENLAQQGIVAQTTTQAEMEALVSSDLKRWTAVIKSAGIEAE
jgi:tripartite-type tricarboxylate transporter receptor subunit TctC